jgi:nitrate reductase / nitrite oxidoreductase, alpha subunit
MLGGAGDGRPALDTDAKLAEAILALSATTNGRLAVQGFREAEKRVGRPLALRVPRTSSAQLRRRGRPSG